MIIEKRPRIKLKCMIVDDSLLYRRITTDAVNSTGEVSNILIAKSGNEALDILEKEHDEVNVIILDVNMPGLSGIETLEIVKSKYPNIEVIMLSSLGGKGEEITIEALSKGAIEFIVKPVGSDIVKNIVVITSFLKSIFIQIKLLQIRNKIHKNLSQTKKYTNIKNQEIMVEKNNINNFQEQTLPHARKIDFILIASSTGGPAALQKLFKGIKTKIEKPIFIVQHMPKTFTKYFANSLGKVSLMEVVEFNKGESVLPGKVIIAQGGKHLICNNVNNNIVLDFDDGPSVNGVKPAADVLFESVSQQFAGYNILTVVLTGMGKDGMNGVKKLKQECNCYCITQSEESCVVYGMPKSVYEAGLSDCQKDLNGISDLLNKIFTS